MCEMGIILLIKFLGKGEQNIIIKNKIKKDT